METPRKGLVRFKEGIIRSIEPIGERDVWDIEVEGDHSYLAHGLVHHNSSSSPNLQNIPKSKRFRDLFTSKPGYMLVDSDFAALELRILALLSQDEAMLQIFRDKVDPHTATAAKMFGKEIKDIDKNGKERKTGKAINFGIVYGEGAKKLGNSLGISRDEAQRYLDDWSRAYPQITNWIRAQHQFVRKNGFVKYSLGRERPLPGIFSDDTGLQAEAERQSVNSQVQGCLKYTTRVTTNTGLHQIGDLYTGKKKATKVWDGRAWRRFTVVDRGPAELAEVRTSDGTIFDCDMRHEFLCHTMKGNVKFRKVTEMDPNQTRLCASHPTPLEFGRPALSSWTWGGTLNNSKAIKIGPEDLPELWFAIGYHVGDGSYSKQSIQYAFGEKDFISNIPRLNKFFSKIGVGDLKVHKSKGSLGNSWQGAIHSAGLLKLFSELGYAKGKAKTKSIPSALWGETLANRRAFAEGYYASDGTKAEPFGTVHCANPKLLRDFRLILQSIGVFSKFGIYANGNARISAHDATTNRAIGIGKGKRFYGLNPDYDFRIFKSLTPLGIVENTYTLSVFHDDHRFDSEGLISKNTGADCTSMSVIRIGDRLRKELGDDKAHIVIEIHDAIVVEVEESLAQKAEAIVIEEMMRQMPMLSDAVALEVDCEIKKTLGDGLSE